MKRWLFAVLPLLALACGRNESTASKSAAAYRDAQARGMAVGGGHDHGGHEVSTATGGAAEVDHSAHGTGADPHAGHDMTRATADHAAHGTTADAHAGHASAGGAAMDHSAHRAMPVGEHAGHGGGVHAQHGATRRETPHDTHAGHGATQRETPRDAHAGHGATQRETSRDAHAGHGVPAAAADPHAGHRQPASGPAHQHSGAGTTTRQPAGTPALRGAEDVLRPDAFDAPAASAVAEAEKARGGGGHEGHGQAEALYVCPMHPEVTSDKPGTCPKCGMALVQKK